MVSDTHLLQRYARMRDAEAFAELVHCYAGLVYGACLRMLGNPDDVQECFLELACNHAIDCIHQDAAGDSV